MKSTDLSINDLDFYSFQLIMQNLPLGKLFHLRRVCKHWNTNINDCLKNMQELNIICMNNFVSKMRSDQSNPSCLHLSNINHSQILNECTELFKHIKRVKILYGFSNMKSFELHLSDFLSNIKYQKLELIFSKLF